MRAIAVAAVLGLAVFAFVLRERDGGQSAPTVEGAERPERAEPRRRPGRPARPRARRRAPRVACPAGLAGCRSVSGSVLYVEARDPDGDGDAHLVLAGGDVTAPGLTVVDIRPALRPVPLPAVGDRVAAAGPVQRGSYGQRQIHAEALRVARR